MVSAELALDEANLDELAADARSAT
jgi:hypothetical protein